MGVGIVLNTGRLLQPKL
ncbi:hypothetical protein GQ607_002265 [Colletotrichum asianum]|uniref:Uncharacterized protein n=1 Tax=Colletotrichum asianum TaxID=702518 RepID=A0A8H3ZWP9_9PEZI|nr:hypothetical protein GQ607_002265 [Colletotrichum asianum]